MASSSPWCASLWSAKTALVRTAGFESSYITTYIANVLLLLVLFSNRQANMSEIWSRGSNKSNKKKQVHFSRSSKHARYFSRTDGKYFQFFVPCQQYYNTLICIVFNENKSMTTARGLDQYIFSVTASQDPQQNHSPLIVHHFALPQSVYLSFDERNDDWYERRMAEDVEGRKGCAAIARSALPDLDG